MMNLEKEGVKDDSRFLAWIQKYMVYFGGGAWSRGSRGYKRILIRKF